MKQVKISGMALMVTLYMFSLSLNCQTFLTRSYTVTDGLVSPNINDITQDKTGRMWFATSMGVTCFDGTTWKNYSASDGLPFQVYTKIRADSRGNIWVFTRYLEDGIYLFDRKRQSWNHLDKPPDINDNTITITSVALLEQQAAAPNRGIYIGIGTYQRGFYIYTKENWIHAGKAQEKQSVLKVIGYNHRFYVVFDSTESTESNLFVVAPESPDDWTRKELKTPLPIYSITIETFPSSAKASTEGVAPPTYYCSKNTHMPKEKSWNENKVSERSSTDEARIWLTGKKWVGYYLRDQFHLLYQGDFPQFYQDIHYKGIITLPDHFKGLWLANSRVILNFHRPGQIKVLGMPENLPAAGAYSLFYDRESNLWIGTYRGLIKITSFRFENFRRTHGLYEDEVTAIAQFDNGDMVFGHNTGFTFLVRSRFYPYEIAGSDRKNVADSRVLDLCKDREGNIWAAASRKGIVKISPTRQMKWCPVIIDGKPNRGETRFSSVLYDNQGNLWASGDGYLFQWKNNRFISRETGIKASTYIRRLFKGKGSTIYITSRDGLFQLEDSKIKPCGYQGNEAKSTYAVYTDKKGKVLVGTRGGLFTLENNTLVKFQDNGFQIERPVYFITEDPEGHLWFGLNNGVIRWSGPNAVNGSGQDRVRHYTMTDGLAGNETNRAAGFVDQQGKLWIGTERGVSCYHRERDMLTPVPPLLELLYMEASGTRYPLDRDSSLNPQHNDLTFHFKGISFIDETAIRFNLKLEGFDKQWLTDVHAPGNRIRYTNVPPGTYRFSVQAINSVGIKSPILSSAAITIEKHFYQTWWFFFLIFLLIVLFILSIANFLTKKRYAAHLEEQIRERTRQLAESEKEFRNIFDSAHDAIIIMDPNQEIIYEANDRACEIYGYTRSQFIGMSLAAISKDVNRGRERIKQTLQQGDYLKFETTQYRKDRTEMMLEVNASVINYKGKLAILSINRDITERKRVEQQIKKSLKEKEILLKEIHHRVKNNLQVISSLLDLQADSLEDTLIIKAFQESKDRIHSMALVHENLYQFGDLVRIDGIEYIQNLVEYIFAAYGKLAGNIACKVEIKMPYLALDMDTAIPIGLILTELLSNVLKHAFSNGEKGEVQIVIRSETTGMLTLMVCDNGPGLPPHIKVRESQSLGLQLVHLLTQQVKGTIEIMQGKGTTVKITFPYKES